MPRRPAGPEQHTLVQQYATWHVVREQTPNPISLRQRIDVLRRIHAGDGMDLPARVIAMLVLVYPHPLSRITRLSLGHITTDAHGRMLIRLGDPPAPVPAPFEANIHDYLAARPNLTAATNPDSALPGWSRDLRKMLLRIPQRWSPECSATALSRPKS